jgi:anaerobic ribonucleoside-triphosphate reductase activating protein
LLSPHTKIYVWTGYLYEDLIQRAESDPELKYILMATDILIDGPYKKELRDITLKMRGSSNQRIIDLTKK